MWSGHITGRISSRAEIIPATVWSEAVSVQDAETLISLTPAYQIADLTEHEQELLVETIDSEQATPSVSQAQRMKRLSRDGELNEDTMLEILSAPKKPQTQNVVLSGKKLEAYFPRSWTPAKIEATIYRLLDAWQRNRQRKSG